MRDKKQPADRDANRDPLTGAPGAHPVGVGAGAATGGAAGAAVGAAVAGPVGAAVGGAVGAVAGGLAGKANAEAVNPTLEDQYWRDNHASRPYGASGSYDQYRPAYQYGWESFTQYRGKRFDEVEVELRRGWETRKLDARLGWDKARPAVHDAWVRVESGRHADTDKARR